MNNIKKFGLVILIVLSLNFLALAGGVGWLWSSKQIDAEKLLALKDLVFPKPVPVVEEAKKSEIDPATTQPILRLERLLEQTNGKSAADQVEFIRTAFETQSALLERQRRELSDVKRQVDLAQSQLTKDRAALALEKEEVKKREAERQTLAADVGFQQTLEVFNGLPTKQVKDLFKTMEEVTVVRYLQAMEPKRASRVMREFKTPEELQMAQALLEQLRKNDPVAAAQVAGVPAN